jgi:hypothetical protein
MALHIIEAAQRAADAVTGRQNVASTSWSVEHGSGFPVAPATVGTVLNDMEGVPDIEMPSLDI